MKMVVGLGNPGRTYARTRHNMGFRALDLLSRRLGIRLHRGATAALGLGRVAGGDVALVQPMLFMNRSGPALRKVLEAHPCEVRDILVICDDVHLAPGRIRIRRQGQSGGHKGLASLIEALGSQAFPRVRLGVGGAPSEVLADHVLSEAATEEEELLDAAVEKAAEAAEDWLRTGDLDRLMNLYNT